MGRGITQAGWKGAISTLLALLSTFIFFIGLGQLVQPQQGGGVSNREGFSMRWMEVAPASEIERLLPPPPPPPPPPPNTTVPINPLPTPAATTAFHAASALSTEFPAMDFAFERSGPSMPALNAPLLAAEAPLMLPNLDAPLYREPPRYPRQAAARQIEGWVDLVFQVDTQGQVMPDTIRVLAAEPEGVFERSARMAIARWRFTPHETSGQRELRQRLEFRMASP